MIKHQVCDNLFVVSSDLYKLIRCGNGPQDHLKLLFNNSTEVLEDKWLDSMAMMVPDREYFDAEVDKALVSMEEFSDMYLKGKMGG